VSFLHRFGSALNRHVHLHACVTDGLFMPVQERVEFLPARPVTPADLLALTERVRTRLVRWFLRHEGIVTATTGCLPWRTPPGVRTRVVDELSREFRERAGAGGLRVREW
ncbi:MAG: transposase, partial [Planctomycetaceae bacterium]